MRKHILLTSIFLAFYLSGCGQKQIYQYQGIKFDSIQEAYEYQAKIFSEAEEDIQPVKHPLDIPIYVEYASQNEINTAVKAAFIGTGRASELSDVEYLIPLIHREQKYYIKILEKYGLFSEVIERENGLSQEDEGYHFYFDFTFGEGGSSPWFLTTTSNLDNINIVTAPTARTPLERVFSFLSSLDEATKGLPFITSATLPNLKRQAELGDIEAQVKLAKLYYEGGIVNQDYQQAYYWYLAAAEQGNASAQFAVGKMCYRGQGTPMDRNEATVWYTKAAEQGEAEAQFELAYNAHVNIIQDSSKSAYNDIYKWYGKAAEQGHAEAQYYLGELLARKGKYEEACKWLSKSAKQGNEKAAYKLHICESQ